MFDVRRDPSCDEAVSVVIIADHGLPQPLPQQCTQGAVHWEMPFVLNCVKAPSEMSGLPSGSSGFIIKVDEVGHCLFSAEANFVPPSSTAYQM